MTPGSVKPLQYRKQIGDLLHRIARLGKIAILAKDKGGSIVIDIHVIIELIGFKRSNIFSGFSRNDPDISPDPVRSRRRQRRRHDSGDGRDGRDGPAEAGGVAATGISGRHKRSQPKVSSNWTTK